MSERPDDQDEIDLLPSLEEPSAVETPDAGVGTLFSDDLPKLASKVTALETMFRLVTADLNFTDFCRELLLVMMKVVKAEAGSILECNHQNRTIFFRTAAGHSSDRIVRFVIPMGQGIVGHVVESKQPLNVMNIAENQMHLKALANAVGFETRNMVALPVFIRGQVFGVVELLNRIGEENFTEEDIELLTSVCESAARAIEIRLMLAWARQSQATTGKKDVA